MANEIILVVFFGSFIRCNLGANFTLVIFPSTPSLPSPPRHYSILCVCMYVPPAKRLSAPAAWRYSIRCPLVGSCSAPFFPPSSPAPAPLSTAVFFLPGFVKHGWLPLVTRYVEVLLRVRRGWMYIICGLSSWVFDDWVFTPKWFCLRFGKDSENRFLCCFSKGYGTE